MVGYLYQVRYALLLAWEKIDQVEDPDDYFISIETLDDISFESNHGLLSSELLQLKHHSMKDNISDRSPDIWKTIRVWCDYIKNNKYAPGNTSFTLVTTEKCSSGSLAGMLSVDNNARNTSLALERMTNISKENTNAGNKKSYDVFNSLSKQEQKRLVESIYVIGLSPDIISVNDKLKKKCRTIVSRDHIDAFVTRLEGVWFSRAIHMLCSVSKEKSICLEELLDFIGDLRDQFAADNLPSDDFNASLDRLKSYGDKLFIKQLRLINSPEIAVNSALKNYYRAYAQRSRWSKDGLLYPGEISKYSDRLISEWENFCATLAFENDPDEDGIKFGQKVYLKCQGDNLPSIRPKFLDGYLARGSYHILSDQLSIGWHPGFRDFLAANDCDEVAL